MPKPEDNAIDRAVTGIERLQRAYTMERMVFLGGVVIGILLLAFLSVMAAFGHVRGQDWPVLFGPGGVFLAMSGGAMIYFNKSLDIVRNLSGREGGE